MSNFLSYDTTSAVSPDPAIGAGDTIILGGGWNPPLTDPTSPTGPVDGQDTVWTGTGTTGIASTIAGSFFSSLGGTLLVEQSFDNINWDIQQSYTVSAGVPDPTADGVGAIDQQVLAPFLRLSYTNGSDDPDPTVRIFVRVFGSGRNNQ
jgi:hypothetical protein